MLKYNLSYWTTYQLFNLSFLVLFSTLFIYVIFFANSGFIVCSIKSQTGFDCPSCGLTRDFYSILHGQYDKLVNGYSMGIFLFFMVQFIMRILLVMLRLTKKGIVVTDIIISVSLWAYFILPMIFQK